MEVALFDEKIKKQNYKLNAHLQQWNIIIILYKFKIHICIYYISL